MCSNLLNVPQSICDTFIKRKKYPVLMYSAFHYRLVHFALKHQPLMKKARQERSCVACFHVCEMTGRLLVARAQGQGKGVTANKYGVLCGGGGDEISYI